LLIHDLGKGHSEDHSEVGLRIAESTAKRLDLPKAQTEKLKFLVHKHLLMAHTAFRRDTSDEALVMRFAVEVGSPEVLQMLFVLSACDLAAVGPGVLNEWKLHILTELYQRARQHLAGHTPAKEDRRRRLSYDQQVLDCLADVAEDAWYAEQIPHLPDSFVFATPEAAVADHLRLLRALAPDDATATGRYLPESDTTEYIVAARGKTGPGTFHRLAGTLAARGLDVLSAEIHTLDEGLVFDRFLVSDADFSGEPPDERIEEVCRLLRTAMNETSAEAPKSRAVWNSDSEQDEVVLEQLSTDVRIDVNSSANYTIIDVFTIDRPGLLYLLTKKIYELGLSVAVAKIATYLDQVLDVFYVTDSDGNKIEDRQRLDEIRRELLDSLEEFADSSTT
ncbi:MAG: hypothetical protein MI757_14285, partial [Pirellulales bacterium]|nr:hypothetical protein [Pirellulales bacterium]